MQLIKFQYLQLFIIFIFIFVGNSYSENLENQSALIDVNHLSEQIDNNEHINVSVVDPTLDFKSVIGIDSLSCATGIIDARRIADNQQFRLSIPRNSWLDRNKIANIVVWSTDGVYKGIHDWTTCVLHTDIHNKVECSLPLRLLKVRLICDTPSLIDNATVSIRKIKYSDEPEMIVKKNIDRMFNDPSNFFKDNKHYRSSVKLPEKLRFQTNINKDGEFTLGYFPGNYVITVQVITTDNQVSIFDISHKDYSKHQIFTRTTKTIKDGDKIVLLDKLKKVCLPSDGVFEIHFSSNPSRNKEYMLGLAISLENKELVILKILPGSPAQKSDLKVGDIILESDGNDLKDMEIEEALSVLTHNEKIDALLKVKRGSDTLVIKCSRMSKYDLLF